MVMSDGNAQIDRGSLVFRCNSAFYPTYRAQRLIYSLKIQLEKYFFNNSKDAAIQQLFLHT